MILLTFPTNIKAWVHRRYNRFAEAKNGIEWALTVSTDLSPSGYVVKTFKKEPTQQQILDIVAVVERTVDVVLSNIRHPVVSSPGVKIQPGVVNLVPADREPKPKKVRAKCQK